MRRAMTVADLRNPLAIRRMRSPVGPFPNTSMPVTSSTNPVPTGTVTFLFTDIEGSTKLWEAHPEAMREALARHDALVREAIVSANGYVFKTVGDAFCAAFAIGPRCGRGARWRCKWRCTQSRGRKRRRSGCAWPCTPARRRASDGDYFGPPVNRVARLLTTGHGGQTLLSQATYELTRDSLPDAVSLRDLGAHRLKDLARPEQVYELLHPDLPRRLSADQVAVDTPEQPAPAIDQLHRAGEGDRGDRGAAGKEPRAHAHRLRRQRQDAPRPAGCRRVTGAVPGRGLVRGTRAAVGAGPRSADSGERARPEGSSRASRSPRHSPSI